MEASLPCRLLTSSRSARRVNPRSAISRRFAAGVALFCARSVPLFQRASGRRGELAHEPIGELPGDRQLAVALELLDRRARVGAENSGRLDRTIAEIAERALHGEHAP